MRSKPPTAALNGLIAVPLNVSMISLGKLVTPTEYALLVALKAIAMALGSFAIAIKAVAPGGDDKVQQPQTIARVEASPSSGDALSLL